MRRWARLLPAIVVGACSAGELALPSPPLSGSAAALQSGVRVAWEPVDGASRYIVFGSTNAEVTRATATITVDDAVSPLVVDGLAPVEWHFRVIAVKSGFLSEESPAMSAMPVPVGTNGLAPLAAPAWEASYEPDPDAHFGYPAIGAGDVNRDGYDDVLVGGMYVSNAGMAFLYLGGPDGPSLAPDWMRLGLMTGGHYAKGLSAGDLDGDGWQDLIVGAAEHQELNTNEGRAWVYRGTGDGDFFEATDSWSQPGDQVNAFMGRFTAVAGDVNGDDRDDFVVERHAFDQPQVNEGFVGLWYGTTGTIPAAPDWQDEGNQADAFFGYALSPRRGDANGDGYDDLLVGAYQYDTADDTDAGAAFLYLGGRGGLDLADSWQAFGENPNNFFGGSLSFAGDVNADGYDDIVVGAENFGLDDHGKAYLYLGGPAGPSTEAIWSFEGSGADENLGMGVGGAGDVNADGYDDVVVGAYNSADGAAAAGRIDLFLGGPSGLAATPRWSFVNTRVSEAFGGIAGSAGDVNGDGSDDLLAGVVSFEGFPVDGGRARLWFGPPAQGPAISISPALDGSTVTLTLSSSSNPGATALSCAVIWGDGVEETTACASAPWTHDYATADTYVIRVRATNAHALSGESFAVVHVR